jgi:hypothetical protein
MSIPSLSSVPFESNSNYYFDKACWMATSSSCGTSVPILNCLRRSRKGYWTTARQTTYGIYHGFNKVSQGIKETPLKVAAVGILSVFMLFKKVKRNVAQALMSKIFFIEQGHYTERHLVIIQRRKEAKSMTLQARKDYNRSAVEKDNDL